MNCGIWEWSVSYTHLDVYKRQVILSAVSRAEMEKYNVLPKHLDGIVNQLRVTKDITVSYTHLDVYKRQLSPAKVISVIADADEKSAKVVVPDYHPM